MNNLSVVWQLSYIAALVYIALMFDTLNAIFSTIIGTVLAILLFLYSTDFEKLPEGFGILMTVFTFVFIGITFLNYSNDLITSEKISAANILTGQVAHEIRTPLLGIRMDAEKCIRNLESLSSVCEWAFANGWQGKPSSKINIKGLERGLRRITDHALSAEQVMSISLYNVVNKKHDEREWSVFSMEETVLNAINSFHFSTTQKEVLDVIVTNDFLYYGSDVLMKHVFFNLIKNSLQAIKAKGRGRIKISIGKERQENCITFKDTGIGISRNDLPYIFLPFHTYDNTEAGAGIGLWFCQKTLSTMGGTITCHSKANHWTRFDITVPVTARAFDEKCGSPP